MVGQVVPVLAGAQVAAIHSLAVALHEGARIQDMDVHRNRLGSLQIVASDHDDAHAGSLGGGHRVLNAVALRVDGRAHAAEGAVLHQLGKLVIGVVVLTIGQLRADLDGRHCKHAKRPRGQRVDLRHEPGLLGFIERQLVSIRIHVHGALLHDVVGGALDVRRVLAHGGEVLEDAVAGSLGDGHHHLAGGRERDLVRLRLRNVQLVAGDLDFLAGHNQRGLRRVALGDPLHVASVLVLLLHELGVGAQDSGAEGGHHAARRAGILPALGFGNATDGGVKALAGHCVVDAACMHGDERHLALGEGAGLVCADDGGGAQGLDGCDLAHEDVLAHHR
mmetsp:Transcript_44947/g.112610  ORF Transcript_44947/g.112610 Transcript_44947/m.112610 type:complete len:334 (+) Transcript_44947:1757-2758(+)